ncbi:hypothetical protein NPX13_g5552 [Xylaria arbuscula]|uniref:NACHT domain-containing protein n=1 Tax=Xylaria arbuscula TaxID=114810 RepID=A0A9W8TKW3_9PEZI|nr:hypothetical protein NPX13_g5552 [Xylaria arbuscula]
MASLEALGLAANIIQLVDFVGKLVTSAKSLYKSSQQASAGTLVLQDVANDLTRLSNAILSPDEQKTESLKQLAQSAKQITGSLLALLDDMRIKGRKTKWKSFLLAAKEVRNEEAVASITGSITHIQTQMILHFQYQFKKDIESIQLNIQKLQESSDRLQFNNAHEFDKLRVDLLDVFHTINTSGRNTPDERHGEICKMLGVLKLEHLMIGDVHTISQKLPDYTSKVTTLGRDLDTIADTQAIIESFWFDRFTAREDNVPEAYAKTYEWVLRGVLSDGTTEIGFPSWLQSGDGIFWVRGKAGSGKSTLMKFINRHPTTLQHLRSWAGSQQLVTGKYYFWNSGTDLHRSQEGLLRSLVFQILRQCPELTILAQRVLVSAMNQSGLKHPSKDGHAMSKALSPKDIGKYWNLCQLTEILENILRHDETKKFFFTIDGIDECEAQYTEDHQHLVDILEKLVASHNVKICVSSRPWTVFMDAFNQDTDRTLKLEDLTKNDIRSYITEKFKAHNQYTRLTRSNAAYFSLVDDVVEKSQGVFLWVFLVVRELLDGLTYHDTIKVMRQRVNSFPDTLEKVFQHMLGPIPKVYRPHTARIFKVAMSYDSPLPMILYSFLEDISNDPSIVQQKIHQPLEMPEFLERQDRMQRRLDAYCKGLLEIVVPTEETGSCFSITTEVNFLHQSVRDFLLSGTAIPTQEPTDEDTWLQLCQAIALLFKRFPLSKRWKRMLLAKPLVYYAKKAQDNGTDCRTINKIISDAYDIVDPWEGSIPHHLLAFEAMEVGLKDFIKFKIMSLAESDILPFVRYCLTSARGRTPEMASWVISCVEKRRPSSKVISKETGFDSYFR